MRFNLKTFFDTIRSMGKGGILTQGQVSGFDNILTEWCAHDANADRRFIAYSLATAWHETGFTMKPVKEKGGDEYFRRMYDITGDRPKVAKSLGNIHEGDGVRFAGGGLVQLTGRANYERVGGLIGKDLIKNPELVLDMNISILILIRGMLEGWFTTRKLKDYFTDTKTDYVGARRIINGTDKAQAIAAYAKCFYEALVLSDTTQKPPREIKRRPLLRTREVQTAAAGISLSTLTVAGDSLQSVRSAFDKVTAATGLSVISVLALALAAFFISQIYFKREDLGKPFMKEWFKW